MKRRRFTNTALPVFSGAECWFQHFHIVQAIVKSNGWPEETAALQLFAHLKGEALNVADPGGGFHQNKQRKSNWRMPAENSKRGHWTADSQEFPSLETWRPEIQRDQPVPVPPKWTGDRRAPRRRFPGIWTGGCGRLKTFSRSLRRTVILGHGESRRP